MGYIIQPTVLISGTFCDCSLIMNPKATFKEQNALPPKRQHFIRKWSNQQLFAIALGNENLQHCFQSNTASQWGLHYFVTMTDMKREKLNADMDFCTLIANRSLYDSRANIGELFPTYCTKDAYTCGSIKKATRCCSEPEVCTLDAFAVHIAQVPNSAVSSCPVYIVWAGALPCQSNSRVTRLNANSKDYG